MYSIGAHWEMARFAAGRTERPNGYQAVELTIIFLASRRCTTRCGQMSGDSHGFRNLKRRLESQACRAIGEARLQAVVFQLRSSPIGCIFL